MFCKAAHRLKLCFNTAVSVRLSTSAQLTASTKLEGKVAIVSASTEGIGFAVARRLGLDGASVVVSSRKQKNVDQAVEQLRSENISVLGTVCHVGKQEHRTNLISKTIEQFGGIDLFVSNTGANPYFGPTLDISEMQWDKIFEINVKSTFFFIKEVVPHIEKRGGGAVVINSSIAGYQGIEMLGPYSISKTTLLGMVRALVTQLSSMNIRINAIAPGIIKTNFSETLTSTESISEMLMDTIPLRRFGLPEECAGVVSFLLSEDASYITGETIPITGGMFTRL